MSAKENAEKDLKLVSGGFFKIKSAYIFSFSDIYKP